MLFQYIFLGFVFAAGVGPVNIETAKRGLIGKIIPAALFYLGNVVIDALYILILLFGFSLFTESIKLRLVLGIFGIAYLLYLGIGNIKDCFKKSIFSNKSTKPKRVINPFLEGILVNLANPMAIASWVAFYGVVPSDFGESIFNFFAVMAGAILLGAVLLFATYFFKRIIGEKIMRGISLVSGIALIVFSILFTFSLFNL
ncbi:LysE family transporter [Candidatus Peregrinibacteria bacterium]|jgi:L-lysine exporter family protein LysE/ArgO|nr:LysE family transporter [Candidatus Peregrinibacteria bacterium]